MWAVGRTAMGSPNQPVLGQMGQFGFGDQYTTQIGIQEKKYDFWPKLADR